MQKRKKKTQHNTKHKTRN